MKTKFVFLLLLLVAISGEVFAGGGITVFSIPGGSGSETQTKAYAGLAWTLGNHKSSLRPDVVVGVRSLKVKSNDQVSNGVDLSARFPFGWPLTFDSARLSYVAGKRDLIGNLGIGYSFTNKSYLSTLAAQGSYSRIGADYEFNNGKVLPYLELLTVSKAKKINQSDTLACPSGWVVPPNAVVGDYCSFVPP